MPEFMTVGEVARALGVAADTVRWWTRIGRLNAMRTQTGVRLIERRDVEALAAARAVDARSVA